MTDASTLVDIINHRPVGILSHGASIQALENYIEELGDICWMSQGLFTTIEEYILKRINRRLDILFDCATVPDPRVEYYETKVRLPRIEEFLARPDHNLWITTHGIFRDSLTPYRPDIMTTYNNKLLQVDRLFPQNNIPFYMDVPNSVTLMICSALCGQATKIVLFGYDGHIGENANSSYYHPELMQKEWEVAYGSEPNLGLKRDTIGFNERFPNILPLYRQLFGNKADIVNCSPGSIYTCLRTIGYDQLKEELK